MNKAIVLVGFKNAGKTTVGQILATKLKLSFIDTDALILNEVKMNSIEEVYEAFGDTHFRQLEANVIANLDLNSPLVIATGGGSIVLPQNRAVFKKGWVIYLKVDFHEIEARCRKQFFLGGLKTKTALKNLYDYRLSYYNQIANLTLEIHQQTINDIVQEIICQVTH